jgi:hypothetical protein
MTGAWPLWESTGLAFKSLDVLLAVAGVTTITADQNHSTYD